MSRPSRPYVCHGCRQEKPRESFTRAGRLCRECRVDMKLRTATKKPHRLDSPLFQVDVVAWMKFSTLRGPTCPARPR